MNWFWLVNCIQFNWIICGFFILTKFLSYTIFLGSISPSVIIVIQKHPNFREFLPVKFQSSLRDRKICVLSGSLSEISVELESMHYYLLLLLILIRIRLRLLLLLPLFIIYYFYYLEFYIVPH